MLYEVTYIQKELHVFHLEAETEEELDLKIEEIAEDKEKLSLYHHDSDTEINIIDLRDTTF